MSRTGDSILVLLDYVEQLGFTLEEVENIIHAFCVINRLKMQPKVGALLKNGSAMAGFDISAFEQLRDVSVVYRTEHHSKNSTMFSYILTARGKLLWQLLNNQGATEDIDLLFLNWREGEVWRRKEELKNSWERIPEIEFQQKLISIEEARKPA